MAEVIFKTVHNGRPRFDFGLTAPPKWLADAVKLGRFRVEDGKAYIGTRQLTQGDEVKEGDVWSS